MEKTPHWSNLVWQPLCATLFLFSVLICFKIFSASSFLWAVGAGSLASSCYIVFGSPSSHAAEPKVIILGYIIGIVSGEAVRFLIQSQTSMPNEFLIHTDYFYWYSLLAVISVTLTLYAMSIFKVKHPPAAGIALVLVLESCNWSILFIIFLAALVLAWIKLFLNDYLIDL